MRGVPNYSTLRDKTILLANLFDAEGYSIGIDDTIGKLVIEFYGIKNAKTLLDDGYFRGEFEKKTDANTYLNDKITQFKWNGLLAA